MTSIPTAVPACTAHADLFQHPLVEDAAGRGSSPEAAALLVRAAAVCASCPLAHGCLFDAVTRHDVAGFVAGTTAAQRVAIRGRLGVRLAAENLDTAAGVTGGGRPVDRAEVVRLRQANPDETLDQLAFRLGCSMSTVKRHLRQVRRGAPVQQPTPSARPTADQVWAAMLAVTGRAPSLTRVA